MHRPPALRGGTGKLGNANAKATGGKVVGAPHRPKYPPASYLLTARNEAEAAEAADATANLQEAPSSSESEGHIPPWKRQRRS